MHVSSRVLREEWLGVAIDASEAASRALLSRFRPPMETPLALSYKGPSDVVTDADIASDRAIADVLMPVRCVRRYPLGGEQHRLMGMAL